MRSECNELHHGGGGVAKGSKVSSVCLSVHLTIYIQHDCSQKEVCKELEVKLNKRESQLSRYFFGEYYIHY